MAQTATIVYEVRSTGADTNGGGFDSTAAGTDRSQQDAAQVVINNSSIVCSTPGANSNTLTFVSGYTPSSADVGNVVNITAGTNINAGWYSITNQSSTTWTLNSLAGGGNLTTAGGAGSAITGNMGGALATPGKACAIATGGNIVYVKATATYVMSSSSNAIGGRITPTSGNSGSPSTTRVVGYSSVRTDLGRPTFQASGTTYAIVTLSANSQLENFILDGNSGTGITGVSLASGAVAKNCKAINCKSGGFAGTSGFQSFTYFCEATACLTQSAFQLVTAFGCVAHDNTFSGFEVCDLNYCISCNNTGASSDGFLSNNISAKVSNSIFYGNGRDGIRVAAGNASHHDFINCIAYGNTGKGYDAAGTDNGTIYNCAFGSNTGGNVGGTMVAANQIGTITLTSNPFTNAAGNDFSLNNAGGGGALCRAAGIPGAYSSGMSTTGYIDVGAAQSNITAAGGVNVGAVSVGF